MLLKSIPSTHNGHHGVENSEHASNYCMENCLLYLVVFHSAYLAKVTIVDTVRHCNCRIENRIIKHCY